MRRIKEKQKKNKRLSKPSKRDAYKYKLELEKKKYNKLSKKDKKGYYTIGGSKVLTDEEIKIKGKQKTRHYTGIQKTKLMRKIKQSQKEDKSLTKPTQLQAIGSAVKLYRKKGIPIPKELEQSYEKETEKMDRREKFNTNMRKLLPRNIDKNTQLKNLNKRVMKADRKGSIRRRQQGVKGFMTAVGAIKGSQQYGGPGRPRGSYKYGVPIQVYNQQMREKRAAYNQYQQEQAMRYKTKGFSPEQVQQLQQQQTYQELEQQPMSRVQRVQDRVQQLQQRHSQINIMQNRPGGFQKMRVDTNMHNKLIQPGPSVADEELRFRKWSSETTISPRTQRMLDTIRRIQNKGKSDNIEQQRRIRERDMVGRSMNLMKAHENMINVDMDMTGVSNENILMAPNVFTEDGSNNILRNTRGNLSILNTRDAGNDLHF